MWYSLRYNLCKCEISSLWFFFLRSLKLVSFLRTQRERQKEECAAGRTTGWMQMKNYTEKWEHTAISGGNNAEVTAAALRWGAHSQKQATFLLYLDSLRANKKSYTSRAAYLCAYILRCSFWSTVSRFLLRRSCEESWKGGIVQTCS